MASMLTVAPIALAKGCLPCVVPSRATVLCSHRRSWKKRNRWSGAEPFRTSCGNGPPWFCSWRNHRWWPTARRHNTYSSIRVQCSGGTAAGPRGTLPGTTSRAGAARQIFPPLDHALIQAVACALVADTQPPLRRQSLAAVTARGRNALGKPISRSTVWRRLATDASTPWRYKYGICPRDPQCADKAGPLLDLYAGRWHGQPLGPKDSMLSADEQPSIQARRRCPPSLPPAPRRPASIENAYERGGARPYLAAWDVRRGHVIGRCEPTTGLAPFGRLVTQGLAEEPYRSGERLFWIVDNGSSHRGAAATKRLQQGDSRIILVHTPVHASGRNQVAISFSIIQRKVLTPNDFADLEALRRRLALYEELSHHHPAPFQWKFDRAQLTTLVAKIEVYHRAFAAAQLNCLQEAA
jgi:hypothetical protein